VQRGADVLDVERDNAESHVPCGRHRDQPVQLSGHDLGRAQPQPQYGLGDDYVELPVAAIQKLLALHSGGDRFIHVPVHDPVPSPARQAVSRVISGLEEAWNDRAFEFPDDGGPFRNLGQLTLVARQS
jgi:hypothetical protein